MERLSLTWASRLTDRALAALSKCERLVRQPLPSCRTLMRLLVLVCCWCCWCCWCWCWCWCWCG